MDEPGDGSLERRHWRHGRCAVSSEPARRLDQSCARGYRSLGRRSCGRCQHGFNARAVSSARADCARDHYTMYPVQISFFQRALTGSDQLRQRVAFALHKILVVSGKDLNNQPGWVTPYLQTLDRDAFGNFRQLLEDITLTPA